MKKSELFIFKSAERLSRDVDEWLSGNPAELHAIARHWFNRFRRCGEDVNELLHDGCPTACISGAAFGYVNVFKAHVNIGFFNGAILPDPARLLEGTGKRMRHIKVKPGASVNEEAIDVLILDSYSHLKGVLEGHHEHR